MPSPFPGMDPYLEGEWSTSFQPMIVCEFAHQLNKRLLPRYVALPYRRMVRINVEHGPSGITIPTSIPHVWVKILKPKERQLVTAIEFLTPTNKGGAGREEYLSRRRRLLTAPIHIVEIDLLRSGERIPTAVPLPKAPYFVFVSRYKKRQTPEVWPIALSQQLPIIPIPLLASDSDVILDLQLAMNTAYDDGAFSRVIDYRTAPEVPLSPEQSAWAHEHLRTAGRRP
jgi:hypothetical protein